MVFAHAPFDDACAGCSYDFDIAFHHGAQSAQGQNDASLEFNYFWFTRTQLNDGANVSKPIKVELTCDDTSHGTFRQQGDEGYHGAFNCPLPR